MTFTSGNINPALVRLFYEKSQKPIEFAETFLESPNPNKPGPFKANYAQRLIMESTSRDTVICVSRRAGKCVVGETRVIDDKTNRPKRIDELVNLTGTTVFDLDRNKILHTHCRCQSSGTKRCIRIGLSSGTSITVSTDHLMYTKANGLVASGLLRVGDRLLAPSVLPCGPVDAGEAVPRVAAARTVATRYIADEVFQYNKKSLSIYLHELFDSEGHLCKDGRASIMLQNRPLAFDVQHLLLRLGIGSRVDRDGCLHVEEELDRPLFLRDVVWLDVDIHDVRGPRRWEIIVSITPAGVRSVYDLSVSHPDQLFVANNLLIHNSFSMIAIALWWACCHSDKKVLVFTSSTVQRDTFFEVLDEWIAKNELLQAMQSEKGNHRDPEQRRTFITNSYIAGYVLGISDSNQGKLRSLTADIVIVDEAQQLSDEDWRVIIPIMRGDITRRDKIRTYIAGTLVGDDSYFYTKVESRNLPEERRPANERIIFMPITENPDWTDEMREDERRSVPEKMWLTEYLLQVARTNNSVFRKVDIDYTFRDEYETSIDDINHTRVRFLTIDWDKYQTGCSLLVTQYNITNGELEYLFHESTPQGEFALTEACRRAIEVWQEFECNFLVADKGFGETNFEILALHAQANPALNMAENMEMCNLGNTIDIPDPITSEPVKKQMKPFLVGRLGKRMQDGRLRIPGQHEDLKKQFIAYNVIGQTDRTVKFTAKNEHFLDCFMFAEYAIYRMYENDFDMADRYNGTAQIQHVSLHSIIQPGREYDPAENSLTFARRSNLGVFGRSRV